MNIRAAEISSILKDQIKNFGKDAAVSEVGQVLSVGDGIARVYGLDNVQAGEMVEVEDPFPVGCSDREVLSECDHPNCFALEVNGCSMAPRFHPGDTIVVNPGKQWYSGAYVVARILRDNGSYEATFKQLKTKGDPPDALYILSALNEGYESFFYETPPGQAWQIIGVVVDMKPNLNGKNRC